MSNRSTANKILMIILLQMFSLIAFSQKLNNYFLTIGLKTRITPIYLNSIPDYISANHIIGTQEQPDMHLSGPAVFSSIGKNLGKNLFLVFRPSLRYDMIYQTLPTELPVEDFKSVKERKFLYDLFIDFEKQIVGRNSSFQIAVGGE